MRSFKQWSSDFSVGMPPLKGSFQDLWEYFDCHSYERGAAGTEEAKPGMSDFLPCTGEFA